MKLFLKNIIFTFLINGSFFLILIVGIQNSNQKNKINFLNKESIELPVSFIIGLSFISGSLLGTQLSKSFIFKRK